MKRFTIGRTLGSGGFGVVHLARDRERRTDVALKTLRRMDAADLLRFKQEFRSLADISHPNLVTLYELLAEDDEWFFTMEYVEGSTILDYVRGIDSAAFTPSSDPIGNAFGGGTSDVTTLSGRSDSGPIAAIQTAHRGQLDLDRLRSAFRQLALGVAALHDGGLVHRDLKPSNVLVTPQGRAVVLDFGIASELRHENATRSVHLFGTPAYMSPEQADGEPVSESSDWYSVGVMLYQALTGVLPFSGSMADMAAARRAQAPAPRAQVPDIPADLDAVCRGLLDPRPDRRATGADLLRRLGESGSRVLPSHRVESGPVGLVGRDRHLAALEAAFDDARSEQAVTVLVRGRSGMGKTALVRQFLRSVRERDREAVLLSGRCYERESVPYKALDTIVDAIAKYLRQLGTAEADALLPRDVQMLARLFPVLREVDAVTTLRRGGDLPDSQEIRRRAFAALRDLLGRLADRRPLILFIDDMQWGDIDSCALLGELVAPPDPPGMLLIVSYRSDEAPTNIVLQTLLPALQRGVPDRVRALDVGELADDDVRRLAASLMGPEGGSAVGLDAIVREAGGNPFFVDALVSHAAIDPTDRTAAGAEPVTLDRVVQSRLSRLPPEASRLLAAAAVAAAPVEEAVAGAAAGLDELRGPLDLLRTRRLLRTRPGPNGPLIEAFHDRIREAVVATLGADRLRDLHRALAHAIAAHGTADPERLASHFHQGGDAQAARRYYATAATQASDALAFDRAARLFAVALEGRTAEDPEIPRLRVGLAEALANAGRGREAATAYLQAAGSAGPDESYEWRRRAAEQLLISGNIDEGLKVLAAVLADIGLALARTPQRALLSVLLHRARLRLRGFGYHERPESALTLAERRRIDACWSVAIGLGMADNVRAADFQSRHLLYALRAGEPYRVARALAMEIGQRAVGGTRQQAFTDALIERAGAAARRANRPHTDALLILNTGVARFLRGEYLESLDYFDRAEQLFREACTGVTWEIDTTHIFWIFTHNWTGRWSELARRVPGLIAAVEERGDRYAAAYMRLRSMHFVRLAQDDVAGAREQQRLGIADWSQSGFQIQHFSNWATCCEVDLYDGRLEAVMSRLAQDWPAFTRSLVARIQPLIIQALDLRARAALGLAAAEPSSSRATTLIAAAERDARRIRRERAPWAVGLAALSESAAALLRGRPDQALAHLDRGEPLLARAGMALFEQVARRRRGRIIGGDEGRALVESAEAWMQAETIRRPDRIARMLSPGGW